MVTMITLVVLTVYYFFMNTFMLSLADNPLLSTKVPVIISVLDVNEFSPELAVPSETFVCENSRVGQVNSPVSESVIY